MAFQHADPTPFIPEHLEYEDIPNRLFMVRTVAPVRPPKRNENLAIATIDHLPSNALHFAAVRGVLRDFLELQMRVPFDDIQPTSLGQALVRLTHAYIRDMLVAESPHVFDNFTVSFSNHDKGRNWRATEFNHECWLLLLDFPNDYHSKRHIQQAIGGFARILLFESNPRFQARLLVKAKVKDVQKVPQFIFYEDPDTIGGESWTVQCEVLRHTESSLFPPQEDPLPNNMQLENALPFDFFGLGQPVNGTAQHDEHIQDQGEVDGDPWTELVQAEELGMQNEVDNNLPYLKDIPEGVGENNVPLDLNQIPIDQDLDLVIINNMQLDHGDDFIEVADILEKSEQVNYLLQQEGAVFLFDPQGIQEQQLMDLANEMEEQSQLNLPGRQGSPINFLVDDLPLDQLVCLGEEGIPEVDEAPENMQNENGPIIKPVILDHSQHQVGPHLDPPRMQAQLIGAQQAPQDEASQAGNQVINDHIMPEENNILEDVVADNFQQIVPQQNQNIHLWMDPIEMEDRDPAWSRASDVEATRLMARFFSSGNDRDIQDHGKGNSKDVSRKNRSYNRPAAIIETEMKGKKTYPVARARITIQEPQRLQIEHHS